MKKILLVSLLLLTNTLLFAQVPANDECANATLLTTSTTCSPITGTIANATTSTITTSCAGSKDVFYKFVANATTATVNVTGSSGLDVEVATFSACGTAYLSCVDVTYAGQTETANMTGLTIGNTYYIKVQDWSSTGSASTYTFTICVVSTPAVVNDVCANATLLTTSTSCSYTSGTLLNATTSTTVPSCRGSYNSDVFYKFVANATSATVTVAASSGLDPIVAVYSACGGSTVGCIDAGNDGTNETLNLTGLTIGTTYFIQVADYSTTLPTTPTFSICVVSTPPTTPVNDECANATLLTTSTTCSPVSGTLLNATTSTTTPSCAGSKDVFYKFVANATTATVTVTGSSGLDVEVATFSACGGTSLSCLDATLSGQAEITNMSGLTIGNTYYIKVQDYSTTGSASTYTFTICVVSTPVTAPVNDVCANATSLTPSTTCTYTAGTILNATTSSSVPTCRNSFKSDVFYKFVANATTATVTVAASTGLDPIVAAYSSCGGTSVGCVDAGNDGANETLNLTGLVIGTTYFIQVAQYGGSTNSTSTFSICVVSTPTVGPPPANDVCANAINLTPSAACVATSGTIENATNSAFTVCPGNYDVYYKFTAAATSATVTVNPSNTLDPVLGVFTSCSATSSIACVDNGSSAGVSEVATLTNLSIGTQYFIKVSSYWATTPTANSTFTICVQNGITTATQGSTALSAISLYPNPTQNVLHIENISIDTKIELIDLAGRTVLVQDLSADAQIDLSNYSAGVYVLKLTSEGVSENRRVVLSK